LDGLYVKLYCGKAEIDGTEETSLWSTFEEFGTEEYDSQSPGSNSESDLTKNYFFQHRLYCKDFVESLNPYTGVTIVN
jgi:hypothetical protein